MKREQRGWMPSLAVSFSDWKVHDIEAAPGARVDYVVRGAHIVTPENAAGRIISSPLPLMCRA